MKQLCVFLCVSVCVCVCEIIIVPLPECVCFELLLPGEKIHLGVSTAVRQPEGSDAIISIRNAYIESSWIVLQHIHRSWFTTSATSFHLWLRTGTGSSCLLLHPLNKEETTAWLLTQALNPSDKKVFECWIVYQLFSFCFMLWFIAFSYMQSYSLVILAALFFRLFVCFVLF